MDQPEVQRLVDPEQRYHKFRENFERQIIRRAERVNQLPNPAIAILCDYFIAREEVEKQALVEADVRDWVIYTQQQMKVEVFRELGMTFSDMLLERERSAKAEGQRESED